MPKIKELHVMCLSCQQWFRCPMIFNSHDYIDTAMLEGKKGKCPHCGQLTSCNQEHMRIIEKDSDLKSSDT